MTRNIVTKRDIELSLGGAAAFPDAGVGDRGVPPGTPDDYPTRLMKLIPAEVVTFYIGLDAIVQAAAGSTATQGAEWFIFFVGLAATPLYLWRRTKVDKPLQLLISTVAFLVWIFAIGGPFANLPWYEANKLIPALMLPIYTFLTALVDP